ncbi:uncharacterized protein LOC119077144 [Bradysia coprophila]|uniref:uncharacterized protein LOC119077144 n=1 Tax=Bradysia coprophila TaxID=38358 RepID=UPI00187DD8A0|nr:uncharacterized protein LOC119077144 [Bradysia coprophila]
MKMMFNVLQVITLSFCLGKICSASNEFIDEKIKYFQEHIRDNIYGVSEKFVDDVTNIIEKYRTDPTIVVDLSEGVLRIGRIPKEKKTKIDAKIVEEFFLTEPYFQSSRAFEIKIKMDYLKILQSILSRQLQPEQYDGVLNLLYIFLYQNATLDEKESALGYLYGSDTAATKTTFLSKFPDLGPTECSDELRKYSIPQAEDMLKSMIDIKPKVLQDFLAIREKFSCNFYALKCLQSFVKFLERFQGNEAKINACFLKESLESLGNWESSSPWQKSKEYIEYELQKLESLLSARLTDETIRGILNFIKATIPNTPIDEIEKSLEYLYDDVPKTECHLTESSTLQIA